MDEKLEFDTPHLGEVYTIVHCLKAEKSFRKAIERVSPAGKRKKFERAIVQQIKRLASGQRMSKANFPREGRLPNLVGKTGNDHFMHLNAFQFVPIVGNLKHTQIRIILAITYIKTLMSLMTPIRKK